VPVPDCAVTSQSLPGTLFPRVVNSSGISRTAPDHPREPGGCDHAGVALADLPVTADSAPCGQPLVPTGTQSLVRIFSNKGILPGAPLRNRTVDLLLTMETLCRLS
jgi:hypothetical protein